MLYRIRTELCFIILFGFFSTIQAEESSPVSTYDNFKLRFVASPEVGIVLAGSSGIPPKTGLIIGGEVGLDVHKWLSVRIGIGTGQFGKVAYPPNSEEEVRVWSFVFDISYTLGLGKMALDVGAGPGVYQTFTKGPSGNSGQFQTLETKVGGNVRIAYRLYLSNKLSLDLKNRFHVLSGGVTWMDGVTTGMSFYF